MAVDGCQSMVDGSRSQTATEDDPRPGMLDPSCSRSFADVFLAKCEMMAVRRLI